MANVKVAKWKPEVMATCTHCHRARETTAHLFWFCSKIHHAWLTLSTWMKRRMKIQVEFTYEMVTFCNNRSAHKALINVIILIVKQNMYTARCLKIPVTFMGALMAIVEYYEKLMAYRKNKQQKFYRNGAPLLRIK